MSGSASGPSEPHLPDTARLRWPLRTTQETGLNHFFDQYGLNWFSPSNLPGSLPTEKTGPGQQTRRNRKAPKRGKGRRESPQKSDTSDGNTRHTRKDANRPRDKSEPKTGREPLCQIWMGFDVSDIVGCLLTQDVSDIVVSRLHTVLGSSR